VPQNWLRPWCFNQSVSGLLLLLGKAGRYAGGNSVCVRPMPEWQKGISTFMKKLPDKEVEADGENQPIVEVTDDAAVADNGTRSLMHFFFFSYACHKPLLVSHETASSSTECSRDKPPFSFVRGQDSTMWDIIWVSPQGHRSVSVSRHFLLQAPQCPCYVRKRFSKDHCCRGRSKPGCRIVGCTDL